jgi:NAD(P)-dependent dehydrogenase (short-subunit alcohol dehydrogenase family)
MSLKPSLSLLIRPDGTRVLDGKTALIIGASRGIGAAAAAVLAGNGAKVVLVSRTSADLDRVAGDLRAAGGIAEARAADVNDAESIVRAVEFAKRTFGSLDIAVNSAAMALPHTRLADTEIGDFDRLMHVNARGAFAAMKYEIAAMIGRGGGSIVNVSSVGGLIGSAGRASYVASKHALNGITKSAALEYAKDHIRINAVAPGVTRTELIEPGLRADPALLARMTAAIPMGRIADPLEIANAIAWLASDFASFVTGAIVPVDGGFTVP